MLVCELSMGGAARVVRDHAQAFQDFAEVVEVVFDREDGVDFTGDEVISLDVSAGRGPVGKVRALARRVRRYDRVKRDKAVDISFSHLEGAHYVDLLGKAKAKRVVVVHGSIAGNDDIRGALGWLRRRWLIPSLYRRADAIVTVSRDAERELRAMGLRNVRTINNFFDVEAIEKASRIPLSADEQALFAGRETLITVGRLADQKKQASLLDMVASLKRDRPVSLLLLGDGPLRGELIGRARALGLETWAAWDGEPLERGRDVYFLGVDANPFRFVRAADLFLLPSGWEGFPLALCEAMACGTAVVAADCPTGPREILAPDSATPDRPIESAEASPFGVLMPLAHRPESHLAAVNEWTRTIADLLDDRGRIETLQTAARRRVEDFSRERIVGQWRDLIAELLDADA